MEGMQIIYYHRELERTMCMFFLGLKEKQWKGLLSENSSTAHESPFSKPLHETHSLEPSCSKKPGKQIFHSWGNPCQRNANNRVTWSVLPALNKPRTHPRDSHREPPCPTFPAVRKIGEADRGGWRPFKAKSSRQRTVIFHPRIKAECCRVQYLCAGCSEPSHGGAVFRHGHSQALPTSTLLPVESHCHPQSGLVLWRTLSRMQQKWCSEIAEPRKRWDAFTSSLLEPSCRPIRASRLDTEWLKATWREAVEDARPAWTWKIATWRTSETSRKPPSWAPANPENCEE